MTPGSTVVASAMVIVIGSIAGLEPYEGGAGYGYRSHRPWHHTAYHYGYGYHRGYAPRYYGYREHTLRRYY